MGKVIWFTGLSGSGKTTIAVRLKKELESTGKTVEILDGDSVRNTLNKHLGFSREDIKENNRVIAELAKKKMSDVDFVLVPIISPYREDRAMVRNMIGKNFVELFINASLNICIKRDVKDLYKKALSGEIKNFIGVSESNPYEAPIKPDLEIKTDSLNIEKSIETTIKFFKNKKWI